MKIRLAQAEIKTNHLALASVRIRRLTRAPVRTRYLQNTLCVQSVLAKIVAAALTMLIIVKASLSFSGPSLITVDLCLRASAVIHRFQVHTNAICVVDVFVRIVVSIKFFFGFVNLIFMFL